MSLDQYNKNVIKKLNNFNSNTNDPIDKLTDNYLSNIDTMYDNKGKYFDNKLFNQRFDNYIAIQQEQRLLKQKIAVNDLNAIEQVEVAPYQLPFDKILFNMQQMCFTIIDNSISYGNPFYSIKVNDIFYLGLLIIILVLLYLFLYIIFVY